MESGTYHPAYIAAHRDSSTEGTPLYRNAFSASQTALLEYDIPLSTSAEDMPTDAAPYTSTESSRICGIGISHAGTPVMESQASVRREAESPQIGMALTSSMSPSIFMDGFLTSRKFSRTPSVTADSIDMVLKGQQLTPPRGYLSGSFRYGSLQHRSPTQTFGRSGSAGAVSWSDHSHPFGSPESSCLGEKMEGTGGSTELVYNFDFVTEREDDDDLHTPDPNVKDGHGDDAGTIFTSRGLMNVGFLSFLASGLLMLFGGYPVLVFSLKEEEGKKGGFNIGGTNASGQVPFLPNFPSLIDKDTPKEAYTKKSADGSKTMKLVFSDEFNVEGRSFYPGDDPFWEAVDLNYWGTQNYEWYDPAAVTTEKGSLVISLSEVLEHNLNFRGGMLTSWNKVCFTGGQIEVRAMLPGSSDISGLWPAAWTMGNLGRAGYGATTDGMWPYTYDSCDVGTLANQTWPKSRGGGPIAAETTGVYVAQYGPGLSYLPGQRLSRCTCQDSKDHPGPRHPDGSFVGRSAPEIDIIEAQASNNKGDRGHVSMSLQLAPYDSGYNLTNTQGSYDFYNKDAILNTYTGSVYQQAASGLVQTNREVYEDSGGHFQTWGFEYKTGGEADSYITWFSAGDPMWRLNSKAMGPNKATEIGQRLVPPEPMYILLNLGISSSFTYVNWQDLHFPAKFRVDYVRIWQPEDEENIGCDPPGFPTKNYIERHWEAYHNPNLTTFTGDRLTGGFEQKNPGNSLLDQC